MRNVKIEIHLTSPSDYTVIVGQLAARYIAHEAVLVRPIRFTITVISSHSEVERQVDQLVSGLCLQSIKTPFTVVEKPKHASPVCFLKRAA